MSLYKSITFLLPALVVGAVHADEHQLDLSNAVVVRPNQLSPEELNAVDVLVEEVERRTGIRWSVRNYVFADPNPNIPMIRIGELLIPPKTDFDSPRQVLGVQHPVQTEGYLISQMPPEVAEQPTIFIAGVDARGVLFGVGRFLRELEMKQGSVQIASGMRIESSPADAIRGHQIGYRARANSWDAWTVEQMEQHIRELTFFGVNSIENIPFQDTDTLPLGKVTRREMNRAMSEICAKYGLDYWVWTPATFDLNDQAERAKHLDEHEALYRDCPELTGVFFPGGDPGDNPPELVLPFLEDVSKRLMAVHPDARVWLSMQGFNRDQVAWVRDYIVKYSPDWLGGLVAGPSAPSIPGTRLWLPEKYQFRLYPDITHNKLCQYPVPWWDQAYALTLGREAINPRPTQYAAIHNWFAPYSDGFISYSDGVHDDVNKAVWSAMGWDPQSDVRDVMVQYARVFFNANVAEDAADGILALEKNWRGPVATNGAVDGTLLLWQRLEQEHPDLKDNWRWQMCLLRANYDAYVRHRLIYETALEDQANAVLLDIGRRDPDQALDAATEILQRATTDPVRPDLRRRVDELCAALYKSIGLQTSVETYHASGAERGAILDFVDYPLNNRWWLEDELAKVRELGTDEAKRERVFELANWEHPGPGGFYDDIGNVAKSPHVKRSEEVTTIHGEEALPSPTHWWLDNGMSRARLAWQVSMEWPEAVVYEGLEAKGTYLVRTTGYGQGLLRVDGERVAPTRDDGVELGAIKEFPVPAASLEDRKIELTWDRPTDERHLNWRQQSRVCEVWLLKKN